MAKSHRRTKRILKSPVTPLSVATKQPEAVEPDLHEFILPAWTGLTARDFNPLDVLLTEDETPPDWLDAIDAPDTDDPDNERVEPF